jgi:hypothetical protein
LPNDGRQGSLGLQDLIFKLKIPNVDTTIELFFLHPSLPFHSPSQSRETFFEEKMFRATHKQFFAQPQQVRRFFLNIEKIYIKQ